MRIITRAQWGARPPKSSPVTVNPQRRQYYVVHHSGAPATQTVRAIQDWCMDGRGFNDIDYNHLVRSTTGEIYEGRGWDVVGAHTENFNTSGVGVCVIGDDPVMSDAAKEAVLWLYGEYCYRAGHPLVVKGHRQLATTGTDCPGDRIASWLAAGMPRPEEDDMQLTDEFVLSGDACEALGKPAGTKVTVRDAINLGLIHAARESRDHHAKVMDRLTAIEAKLTTATPPPPAGS